MIVSTAAQPFTPRREGAPTFMIRPATLTEKAMWRYDIDLAGARIPTDAEVAEAARRALRDMPELGAEMPVLLDLIDAVSADPGLREKPGVATRIADLEALLAQRSRAFRALAAERRLWLDLAPLFAARRFVAGWSGDGVPDFARGADGLVSEAALAGLEPGDVTSAGWRAIALMNPDRGQEKNSASPSKSGATQTTSAKNGSRVAKASSPTVARSRKTRA